jgi:hypothetical protein
MQGESLGEKSMKSKFLASWKLLPSSLRKLIVLVFGFTFILAGILLIVLPGPFTIPLIVFGLFILAAEFAWAETLLHRVKAQGKKLDPRKLFKGDKPKGN